MKTITITESVALDALKAARDERGAGFCFFDMFGEGMGCFYHADADTLEGASNYDDGEPSSNTVPACHVGLAFHIIDPDLDAFTLDQNGEKIVSLFGLNCYKPAYNDEDGHTVVFGGLTITVTGKALRALAAAQDAQDNGASWDEGLSAAEEILAAA